MRARRGGWDRIRAWAAVAALAVAGASATRADGPIRATQPGLRDWARECLANGWIAYEPPEAWLDGARCVAFLGAVEESYAYEGPAGDQLQVELIRLERKEPAQRAFWEPYLRRVEATLAEELAYRRLVPEPDGAALRRYRDEAARALDEAVAATAAGRGLTPVRSPVPRSRYTPEDGDRAEAESARLRAGAGGEPEPVPEPEAEPAPDGFATALRKAEAEVAAADARLRARLRERVAAGAADPGALDEGAGLREALAAREAAEAGRGELVERAVREIEAARDQAARADRAVAGRFDELLRLHQGEEATRIEEAIRADEMYQGLGKVQGDASEDLRRIERRYAGLGLLEFQEVQGEHQPRYVRVATDDPEDTILYVPKTRFLLARLNREEPAFVEVRSGEACAMIGVYAYKVRRKDGTESAPRFIEIGRDRSSTSPFDAETVRLAR
jgi:hypothetical protein